MCTLSLVASRDGSALRILMNRDERRSRMAAAPPQIVATQTATAVWPRDLDSGGTWIAVSDAGLCFALLNLHGPDALLPPQAELSRGHVIPALLDARSLDDVDDGWRALAREHLNPFRLVVASRTAIWAAEHRTAGECPPLRMPVSPASGHVFTSSSLGDHRVDACRRELFAALMGRDSDPWQAQARFHQHAWPDRRDVSVLMSRADACTVSRTEVHLTEERADLRYCAIVDGWPAGVRIGDVAIDIRRRVAAA